MHVSVAGLMNAAGITHGGFCKQFASKEALIDEAPPRLRGTRPAARHRCRGARRPALGRRAALIDVYFCVEHRDNAAEGCGCPAAALAVGTARDPDRGGAHRVASEQPPARAFAA
ncbi:TetR/AcrR family transcriptional regulator, partial [Streptomyces sp. TRM76130]|nr:TetR/AcrR family transcriptional regulator [Streptomyces sp. TRM76130]